MTRFKVTTTITALVLLGLLAGSGLGATAPRWADTTARAWGNDNKWGPGELESWDAYTMLANAYRPEEARALLARNPHRQILYNFTGGRIPNVDYEGGWQMPSWMVADTSWSPDRALQLAFIRNLAAGVDWTDRDGAGRPRTLWGGRAVRWDAAAPRGVWGQSRGLTPAEYTIQVIRRLSLDPGWPWTGWFVDTLPDRPEQRAASTALVATLVDSPRTVVMGVSKVDPTVRARVDGLKLEDWLWAWGTVRHSWSAWWYGVDYSTPGYVHAGRLALLDAQVPPWGWSPERERQYWRYALATSLLGDGWVGLGRFERFERCQIPELAEWQFRLPAITGMYWMTNLREPSRAKIACRVYAWAGSGRYVTVCADTLAQEGYLVDGWWGPGRIARETPQEGRR